MVQTGNVREEKHKQRREDVRGMKERREYEMNKVSKAEEQQKVKKERASEGGQGRASEVGVEY